MDATNNKSYNPITLNCNIVFIIAFISIFFYIGMIFNTQNNIYDNIFFVIYGAVIVSVLFFSCNQIEIGNTELIVYYFWGILGKKIYALDKLKGFYYKENSRGKLTNFTLSFPEKKIQLTMFHTNFNEAVGYLNNLFPELSRKRFYFYIHD